MAPKSRRKKSNPATPRQTPQQAIVAAALTLAADRGWNKTSLKDIADEAGLSLAALHDHIEDRYDILALYARALDQAVIKNAEKPDRSIPPRDRIFDILMERFDLMNNDRDGLVAILESMKTDPKQALYGLPHVARSMGWMCEAAGIDTGGTPGALRVAGLSVVYLKTLWTWCGDDTDDMGRTMADLDKNLGYAEQLHSFIDGEKT